MAPKQSDFKKALLQRQIAEQSVRQSKAKGNPEKLKTRRAKLKIAAFDDAKDFRDALNNKENKDFWYRKSNLSYGRMTRSGLKSDFTSALVGGFQRKDLDAGRETLVFNEILRQEKNLEGFIVAEQIRQQDLIEKACNEAKIIDNLKEEEKKAITALRSILKEMIGLTISPDSKSESKELQEAKTKAAEEKKKYEEAYLLSHGIDEAKGESINLELKSHEDYTKALKDAQDLKEAFENNKKKWLDYTLEPEFFNNWPTDKSIEEARKKCEETLETLQTAFKELTDELASFNATIQINIDGNSYKIPPTPSAFYDDENDKVNDDFLPKLAKAILEAVKKSASSIIDKDEKPFFKNGKADENSTEYKQLSAAMAKLKTPYEHYSFEGIEGKYRKGYKKTFDDMVKYKEKLDILRTQKDDTELKLKTAEAKLDYFKAQTKINLIQASSKDADIDPSLIPDEIKNNLSKVIVNVATASPNRLEDYMKKVHERESNQEKGLLFKLNELKQKAEADPELKELKSKIDNAIAELKKVITLTQKNPPEIKRGEDNETINKAFKALDSISEGLSEEDSKKLNYETKQKLTDDLNNYQIDFIKQQEKIQHDISLLAIQHNNLEFLEKHEMDDFFELVPRESSDLDNEGIELGAEEVNEETETVLEKINRLYLAEINKGREAKIASINEATPEEQKAASTRMRQENQIIFKVKASKEVLPETGGGFVHTRFQAVPAPTTNNPNAVTIIYKSKSLTEKGKEKDATYALVSFFSTNRQAPEVYINRFSKNKEIENLIAAAAKMEKVLKLSENVRKRFLTNASDPVVGKKMLDDLDVRNATFQTAAEGKKEMKYGT